MSVSALTRRYAKALVELGVEKKSVDRYGDELAMITEVFAQQPLISQLLESPTLDMNKKEAMLADLSDTLDLCEGVRKFLGLLLSKGRLCFIKQIEEKYQRLADELSGILSAQITSAIELDDVNQQAIASSLEKQTGKQVAVNVKVDPELIGGLKAEIGGRLFDGSLKTQLKRIEESLTKG
ncbi:MAG: F0F1 ATP synthase subunit delta [Deltaproteobacteria bacterium]|nr:F0F1 ATP synthase subunit delta [Deltaproteobacteria bacterium]MBW2519923.1 F0F1 ATP synthase subunit delta [Deltaproteobacteria bacterium]